MAEYERKDMTGGLWKNPKKEDGDNRPNATGYIKVGDRNLRISAWTKHGDKGAWQSLAAEWEDEQKQSSSKPAASNKSLREELNDDIPF